MNNTYLAIYEAGTGFTQINNVGIVHAPDEETARAEAKKLFRTTASVDVELLDNIQNGWKYYV